MIDEDREDIHVEDLGSGKDMTIEEFLQATVGQLFKNDNDTTYLTATLKADNGVQSELEFMIKVVSMNGVKARAQEEDVL